MSSVFPRNSDRPSHDLWGNVVLCLVLLTLTAPAWGNDFLKLIPADAAAILTIRNPIGADRELTQLIRPVRAGFEGLPLADLETTMGFAPGTVDLSKRVTIVFIRPDDLPGFVRGSGLGGTDQAQPVIIFTPRSIAEFSEAVGDQDNRVRRRDGVWCRYYCFTHQGQVYVSNRRKILRTLLRISPQESLARQIDPTCLRVLEESDVGLHLVMAQWREKFNPVTLLVANLIKLSVTSQQSPETLAQSQAIIDWFVDGARDALDQVDGTTIALDMTGSTVSIRHAHSFEAGRCMAEYLKGVRRSGCEPLTVIPDRPFLFVGYSDWNCPPANSLTVRSVKQLLSSEMTSRKLSQSEQKAFLDASVACASTFTLSDYMLCNSSVSLMPFEFYGSYATKDPHGAIDAYERLQTHSGDLWSGLIGGAAPSGSRFVRTTRDGMAVRQMLLNDRGMPEQYQRQVRQAYGPNARLELGAIGSNHLAFAIGEPPIGVVEMAQAINTGRRIAENPAVKKTLSLLPESANVVLVIDADRILKAVRSMAAWPTESKGESPLSEVGANSGTHSPKEEPGSADAMLGWSCSVEGRALNCQLSTQSSNLASLAEALASLKPAKAQR